MLKFSFSDVSLVNLIYELASLLDSQVSTLILYSKGAKPYWPFKTRMSEREWKSMSLPYREGNHITQNQVAKISVPPHYRITQRYKSSGKRLDHYTDGAVI